MRTVQTCSLHSTVYIVYWHRHIYSTYDFQVFVVLWSCLFVEWSKKHIGSYQCMSCLLIYSSSQTLWGGGSMWGREEGGARTWRKRDRARREEEGGAGEEEEGRAGEERWRRRDVNHLFCTATMRIRILHSRTVHVCPYLQGWYKHTALLLHDGCHGNINTYKNFVLSEGVQWWYCHVQLQNEMTLVEVWSVVCPTLHTIPYSQWSLWTS